MEILLVVGIILIIKIVIFLYFWEWIAAALLLIKEMYE